MKKITKPTDLSMNIFNKIPTHSKARTVLLDIETTGFSADYHMIYLIGLIYKKEDSVVFTQFLAENESDEYQLLYETNRFLDSFETIVHFNGSQFDMPFIKKRMALFTIKHTLDSMIEIDLYKAYKSIGTYLPLDNYKLKTIEEFLGFKRQDPYTGGELIAHYKDYVSDPTKHSASDILRHNEEDLIGLAVCLDGYDLIAFITNLKQIRTLPNYDIFMNKNYFLIDLKLTADFEYKLNTAFFHIFINKTMTTISIPIMTGELKLFYEDYENYYFLTKEGYAVHKSVGKLVDRQFRKKAKKSNCFTMKSGQFLPCLNPENVKEHVYYKDYRSKPAYIEITDQFLKETDQLHNYIIALLHSL